MTARYSSPSWADTPAEASNWAGDVDRWHDETTDQRNEARESDFHMPFTDCGGCQKGHCLMCAVRRVCEWRPSA